MNNEIDTEIEELIIETNQIKTQIDCVNSEMQKLVDESALEKEIAILEDELNLLEFKLELIQQKHNALTQLRDYQLSCEHSFVDDLIDLTPDSSKTIMYCIHCYLTQNA